MILKWGAISALIFVSIWTLCIVTHTPMPAGWKDITPISLTGIGFFWGMVLFLIRKRLGPKHG